MGSVDDKGNDNKKKNSLRFNEYYNMQSTLDTLYQKSKGGYNFKKLITLISSEQNIMLAYRSIKRNKGSMTSGVDKKTIQYLSDKPQEEFIKLIQGKFNNYNPKPVRRVEIPKNDGSGRKRPLGIPSIEDRIVQQCIKQIIEPICEAKFHNHNYGFRPNRSTHHAIARSVFLINKGKLHYCVDIDIKSFFDNVNHGKLLKQIWSLGIRDKQLLCIISKMLKAPIENIGIPNKGTPQGGILSPILSNIVLNELDWWIANQWENFNTKHSYHDKPTRNRELKKTKLKEMYIVRYADDFKIFCRSYNQAKRIFNATEKWLIERLGLQISPEKSKITNLRNNSAEFLGFKIKTMQKGTKIVAKTEISHKKIKNIINDTKNRLKSLNDNTEYATINNYNSYIMGIHQYFSIATHVTKSVSKVALSTSKLYKNIGLKYGKKGRQHFKKLAFIDNLYKDYLNKKSMYSIKGVPLIPIGCIKHKTPISFSQDICDYTLEGRAKKHKQLNKMLLENARYIMDRYAKYESVEYNDIRISVYLKQYGKCYITKRFYHPRELELHHIVPKSIGGKDDYKNLMYVSSDIHKIIHAKSIDIINNLINKLLLNNKEIKEINKYRQIAELENIVA
ncbi:TPA: group II intron reverse transcriptase/maturase [Clostridium botulinum]|nr:group II intron reverse transcriptase/maturase [Clostridium botulinum]